MNEKMNSRHSIQTNLLESTVRGTSLVAQWLRISLPMQGTGARSLAR